MTDEHRPHFPADELHPHYPSKDQDYCERIMDGAGRSSNHFRLLFYVYTEAEEKAIDELWARRSVMKGPRPSSTKTTPQPQIPTTNMHALTRTGHPDRPAPYGV